VSKVIEISDSQFKTEVIETNQPVLAYFWAAWCGPCRLTSPSINTIADIYGDRLKVVKLEVDPNPEAVKHCKVEGVPALRLFKEGKIIAEIEGAIGKDKIQNFLDKNL
jgi:thioredoxin 1